MAGKYGTNPGNERNRMENGPTKRYTPPPPKNSAASGGNLWMVGDNRRFAGDSKQQSSPRAGTRYNPPAPPVKEGNSPNTSSDSTYRNRGVTPNKPRGNGA